MFIKKIMTLTFSFVVLFSAACSKNPTTVSPTPSESSDGEKINPPSEQDKKKIKQKIEEGGQDETPFENLIIDPPPNSNLDPDYSLIDQELQDRQKNQNSLQGSEYDDSSTVNGATDIVSPNGESALKSLSNYFAAIQSELVKQPLIYSEHIAAILAQTAYIGAHGKGVKVQQVIDTYKDFVSRTGIYKDSKTKSSWGMFKIPHESATYHGEISAINTKISILTRPESESLLSWNGKIATEHRYVFETYKNYKWYFSSKRLFDFDIDGFGFSIPGDYEDNVVAAHIHMVAKLQLSHIEFKQAVATLIEKLDEDNLCYFWQATIGDQNTSTKKHDADDELEDSSVSNVVAKLKCHATELQRRTLAEQSKQPLTTPSAEEPSSPADLLRSLQEGLVAKYIPQDTRLYDTRFWGTDLNVPLRVRAAYTLNLIREQRHSIDATVEFINIFAQIFSRLVETTQSGDLITVNPAIKPTDNFPIFELKYPLKKAEKQISEEIIYDGNAENYLQEVAFVLTCTLFNIY